MEHAGDQHAAGGNTVADLRVADVANILGVSSDTVRRWCDDGRLTWAADATGRSKHIDARSLAAYLRQLEPPHEPDGVMAQSARNRFTGVVTKVERDGLVALVEIVAPPHRIVSLMTSDAADELGVQPGSIATAAVKSTQVIVEVPSR